MTCAKSGYESGSLCVDGVMIFEAYSLYTVNSLLYKLLLEQYDLKFVTDSQFHIHAFYFIRKVLFGPVLKLS